MDHIGVTPTLRLTGRDTRPRAGMPFPLDRRCLLTFEARYALYHGLGALGLRKGDTLLAPSYCCGTEIDPLIAAGMNIRWYGMKDGFTLDFDQLRQGWDEGVKGVLVVHYLGFNQLTEEIFGFCRDKGMLIIEDCAHALLSFSETSAPLGSMGDASIFSLRKTLPVPDGGALHLRSPGFDGSLAGLTKPSPFAILFRCLELFAGSTAPSLTHGESLRESAARGLIMAGLKTRRAFQIMGKLTGSYAPCTLNTFAQDFVPSVARWGISSLTRKTLGTQNWDEIRERRRRNYTLLLEGTGSVPGVRPLVASLPDGACPLMFPITTDNRQGVQAALLSHGIESHPWWGYFHPAVPWEEHPVSSRLKKTLLGLPVHQDLTDGHMGRILEALGALGKKGCSEGGLS